MAEANGVATKAYGGATVEQAVTKSVVVSQEADAAVMASMPLLWFAGQVADTIVPWGMAPQLRDAQLRAFLPTEPILQSAIGTAHARNAAFEWSIDGPESTVRRSHQMMHQANFGNGWLDFVLKFSADLYEQDKGAFVEIIKDDPNNAASQTIGFRNLDAAQCWCTGSVQFPVIYTDANGTYHKLPWYRVYHATEMPAANEDFYGLQKCAVTRILQRAQIAKNIGIYEDERTSGNFTKAIHVVNGVEPTRLTAALNLAQQQSLQAGLERYKPPVVVTTLDPAITPQLVTLMMAAMPEGWKEKDWFDTYIAIIALGLLSDYIEFAPLPGENLGSSSQAEMLDRKSKAKGARLFRKIVTHMMNFSGILPQNVEFSYIVDDVEAEKEREEVSKIRVDNAKVMIDAGILDTTAARQMLVDTGVISQEVFDDMAKRRATPAPAEQQGMFTDITGPPATEVVTEDDDSIVNESEQVTKGIKALQVVRDPRTNRIIEVRPRWIA